MEGTDQILRLCSDEQFTRALGESWSFLLLGLTVPNRLASAHS